MGWDGYDDVHLHLHTCLMLRNKMFHVGVGWGVHTSHMSKPVITLVFKVPSNGLLNSIKLAQTQSFLRDPYF